MSEIAIKSESVQALSLIEKAIDKGFSPEQLSQLIDMQERLERNAAARQYAEALAGFAADVPAVLKSREANIMKDGKKIYGYKYVSLDDIMYAISPILAKHGIVISFTTKPEQKPGFIGVVMTIQVGTHVEPKTFEMAVPPNLNGNATQQYGSALTYAKRYALVAGLNIFTVDKDTDADGLLDTVTAAEVEALKAKAAEVNANVAKMLEFVEADSFENIPRKMFPVLMDQLRQKGAQKK